MVGLKDLRQQRFLSIRDLAKRADVSPQTIVTIEAGRRPPRPTTMRQLAEALGVEPIEIDEFRAAFAQWTGTDAENA